MSYNHHSHAMYSCRTDVFFDFYEINYERSEQANEKSTKTPSRATSNMDV